MFVLQSPVVAITYGESGQRMIQQSTHKVVLLHDGTPGLHQQLAHLTKNTIIQFHSNTEMIRIVDEEQLQETLETQGEIFIYCFKSNLEGLYINGKLLTWEDFAQQLLLQPLKHHLIAIGNSKQLELIVKNQKKIHCEGSEVIDVHLAYLYLIWTTAEIFEASQFDLERKASEDLKFLALNVYLDDTSDLYSRAIFPQDTLGAYNFTEQYDYDEEEFIPEIYPTGNTLDQLANLNKVIDTFNKSAPLLTIRPASIVPPPDETFSLGKLPGEVSISGPSGVIIQAIWQPFLTYLLDYYGLTNDTFIVQISGSYLSDFGRDIWERVSETKTGIKEIISRFIGKPIDTIQEGLIELQQIGKEGIFHQALQGIANEISRPINEKLEELNEIIEVIGTWEGTIEWSVKQSIQVDGKLKDYDAFKNTFHFTLGYFARGILDIKHLVNFLNHTLITNWQPATDFAVFTKFYQSEALTIQPIFKIGFLVEAMKTRAASIMKLIEEHVGVYFEFGGGGWAEFAVTRLREGSNEPPSCLLTGWGFKAQLGIRVELSLLDLISMGSRRALRPLERAMELSDIKLIVYVRFTIEGTFRLPGGGKTPESTISLKIAIGGYIKLFFGVVIKVFDKKIKQGVTVSLGLELTLTWYMDIAKSQLRFNFNIEFYIKVNINLAWLDWKFKASYYPLGKDGIWINPAPGTPEWDNNAQGPDSDGDGLSDLFEDLFTGLDKNDADTDDDGLNDGYEFDFSYTDALDPDTDDDGLMDGAEILIHQTDPLAVDTDYDHLSDYEEVEIYLTNPNDLDSDDDGLSDSFEVHYAYSLDNCTPTVTQVIIGGVGYNDRTDPWNPDTDGDGLLDGQEGIGGTNYTDPAYFTGGGPIFNYGVTHPLDADTDDDSFLQYANGSIHPSNTYLMDMTDKAEVTPRWFTVYVQTDTVPELIPKLLVTNPCSPDTDNDTLFDAYEIVILQTDPTNNDTDGDGLIDGLEGTNPNCTHTNPLNRDTDGDGLGDLLDVKLLTDPLDPDTDDDLVSDGDEYYIYHTMPWVNDTDNDGLSDGEELYFFYSNPLAPDSDLDGLIDGFEVYVSGTDPMNPDSDFDGITDRLELEQYYTDPVDSDTDDDGLIDGDELYLHESDPLDWDSDDDSILIPDRYGNPSFLWGDGQEVSYGTSPVTMDTDGDGVTDAEELLLGIGSLMLEPLALNPLSNDTDNDGVIDGYEIVIEEVILIHYPYTGLRVIFPLGTNPVLNDTDSDGLSDGVEVIEWGSNPLSNDSDGDTLSDFDEVYYHHTHPANNDTDGDDLADNLELTDHTPGGSYQPIYSTNANKSDTDGDGLPDGLEILLAPEWIPAAHYGINMDPLDGDTNNDGVLDGYQLDSDGDLLTDGDEFYTSQTNTNPGGGYQNPDSDFDGLIDGDEIIRTGTDPTSWDTDGDGYSDYLELFFGTNANANTSALEVWLSVQTRVNSLIATVGGLAVFSSFCAGVFFTRWGVPGIKRYRERRAFRRANIKPGEAGKMRKIYRKIRHRKKPLTDEASSGEEGK